MDLLARREHSRGELMQKLGEKVEDRDLLAMVLDALQQQGLLSDSRFAENYIRYRRRKGFGPLRIKMELKTKHVSDEIIEQLLSSGYNDWLDSLTMVWQKKFGPDKPSDYTIKAKQMRFLQNKGFSPEQINLFFRVTSNENKC